jgi:hypothetical protein
VTVMIDDFIKMFLHRVRNTRRSGQSRNYTSGSGTWVTFTPAFILAWLVRYESVLRGPRSRFFPPLRHKSLTFGETLHCKKSWQSSSTPASGDAGPIHTGIEKSFRHPWRKFYYKYRTYCLQMSTSSTEFEFFKSSTTCRLEPAIFTSTIFYCTLPLHLPYVKWAMYNVYILFIRIFYTI